MRILILNAGSSTLKWTLLDRRERADGGTEDWSAIPLERRGEPVRALLQRIGRFDAVGHRVVQGGAVFSQAVVIDAQVRAQLETLAALDELHMRPALAGIDAVSAELPAVTQVAAFDTAFHRTMPAAAAWYALPHEWSERWGLRRFGFHGLSVQWSVDQAPKMLGKMPARLIVCHLGSGCSITAVAGGKSIDTTMGFTPLDGVMMGTRSGSVDPGLLMYLQARCGVSLQELRDTLANRSGLLGVSGVSNDLRKVMAAETPRARLAYEMFVWTLRRAVGAMAGVLGGADALVFTGGIGENSEPVRRDVTAALPGVPALVIEAREDLVILDEVERLTGGA
jgi:acetate kinase